MDTSFRRLPFAAGLVIAAVAATTAPQAVATTATLDLLTQATFEFDGPATGDQSGLVAAAGDVNGDLDADVITGAERSSPGGRTTAGAAQVVFGPPPSLLDLGVLGTSGFSIEGGAVEDLAGSAVAAAGDVNGDGLGDVIVGASNASPLGRSRVGSVYVVFGRTATTPVNLGNLGSGGYRIDGVSGVSIGRRVAGLEDVNGDGLDEVVVGAPLAAPADRVSAGSVYVVFGRTATTPIDLVALGSGGYRIDGARTGDNLGESVASTGDVGGDGRADLLIGAPSRDSGAGELRAGATYLVYGKVNTTTIDLASLGAAGYRIDGAEALDTAGTAVDDIGDVNSDGRHDALIGAPSAGAGMEGAAYVVYGQAGTTTVDLGNLGVGGYTIPGIDATDHTGIAVAGPGPNAIIGAPNASHGGRALAGAVFVVPPQNPGAVVDLTNLPSGGHRIDGAATFDKVGTYVGISAGATSGQPLRAGLPTLVGAPFADPNGRSNSGAVYGADARQLPAVLGSVIMVPRVFHRGLAGASVVARLRAPATLRIRITRAVLGARTATGCRARIGKFQRAPRCLRNVATATSARPYDRAGSKRLALREIVRGRSLAPGSYRLDVTARNRAGRQWGPGRVEFTVRP